MRVQCIILYTFISTLALTFVACGKKASVTTDGNPTSSVTDPSHSPLHTTTMTGNKRTATTDDRQSSAADSLKAISQLPKREIRAVWLTTLYGLDWPRTKATSAAKREQQKAELCAILDSLKAININTIMFQTRVRGSVIYPSDIEPWDQSLTGTFDRSPGYDPLAFAIEETHRRGMELHAWVVTIPCFKTDVAKRMGPKSVLQTHKNLCLRFGDTWYLNPGQPGSANYLSAICTEIARRYDIDGIHFDYIRYPEQGASFPDAATFKRYGAGQTKSVWRRNNITNIVRQLYADIKSIKPWIKVSSSPVGKYANLTKYSSRGWNARDAVHQDAQAWMRDGIHDILFPMMYFRDNNFFPFAADWQQQSAGRHIAPGLGIYFMHPKEKNWPLSDITSELHFTRLTGMAGQCYFRSKFLTGNVKGLYDYLQQVFYTTPALPPACTWLNSTPPSKPTAAQIKDTSEGIKELTWQATSESPGGLRYNIYASNRYPVDTTDPANIVTMLLREPRFRFDANVLACNGLNLAITAIDRTGNESPPLQIDIYPNPTQQWKLQFVHASASSQH
ncbi:MAG: family 10 glycosylhydrolase [Bacteroidaceae bacterium]|nr:family 10 glycosylhydrolase [Bacteroidaceae bacterium]